MTVAGPAQIVDFDSVRLDVSDQCRANKKIVLVEVPARTIVVEMKTELSRVAMKPGVLPEKIRDENGLVAEVRRVELAVGVLLEHIKVSCVELVTIVGVIAKH